MERDLSKGTKKIKPLLQSYVPLLHLTVRNQWVHHLRSALVGLGSGGASNLHNNSRLYDYGVVLHV